MKAFFKSAVALLLFLSLFLSSCSGIDPITTEGATDTLDTLTTAGSEEEGEG